MKRNTQLYADANNKLYSQEIRILNNRHLLNKDRGCGLMFYVLWNINMIIQNVLYHIDIII